MAYLNDNYLKLKAGYLFPEIGRRVKAFCEANPEAAQRLIRCGIGDVTEPLPPAVIAAMHQAVDEMARARDLPGLRPGAGLRMAARTPSRRTISATAASTSPTTRSSSATARSAIAATSSTSSAHKNSIAITDPVYPVYVDTNVMAGHTGAADEAGAYGGLVYLPCTPEQRLHPRAAEGARGRHLPLLAEQPDRRRRHARAARGVGELRARAQGGHPLRRRLRGLHHRPGDAAFDLRDPRRARVRHRVPQLLEERRLHRHALRVHRGAQDAHARTTASGERKPLHPLWLAAHDAPSSTASATSSSAAPRRSIRPKARRRCARSSSTTWATPQCCAKARSKAGLKVFGGVNAPYIWVRTPEGRHELAGVRQDSRRGQRGHHARQRLRLEGRRLLPHQRLQQPRQRRGSRAPVAGVEVGMRGRARSSKLKAQRIRKLTKLQDEAVPGHGCFGAISFCHRSFF